MEQFQKKTMKQILSLPSRTADPAIYILLEAETIEQIIHKAMISLFLRVIKDQNSLEYEIGLRQLSIKSEDSHSWFIKIDKILRSYNLPSAHEIILQPKKNWKKSHTPD